MSRTEIDALRQQLAQDGTWTTPQFMSFSPSERQARAFAASTHGHHGAGEPPATEPVMITAHWPGARDLQGASEELHLVLPDTGLKRLGETFYTHTSQSGVHHFTLIGAQRRGGSVA
ncbi:hypothetical protein [Stenotrophomonas sp. NPDC077659]|uniref:hypothetical protein n=1 Tax=Stenotrophomonas sp. NPDC077659 TaxID=3390694 RepID=UPI003D08E693